MRYRERGEKGCVGRGGERDFRKGKKRGRKGEIGGNGRGEGEKVEEREKEYGERSNNMNMMILIYHQKFQFNSFLQEDLF